MILSPLESGLRNERKCSGREATSGCCPAAFVLISYTIVIIFMENIIENGGVSFKEFMLEQIRGKMSAHRYGTANNYRSTLRSFMLFLEGRDIAVAELTAAVAERYAEFLMGRGVMRNTVSFYMRILRAVYNKAVRQGLSLPSEPFRKVYTGVDKTRKRAVGEQLIRQLYKLDLEPDSSLRMARDIFIFSYCARGMSFVDIAYLKKADVDGEYIYYVRRKTGQHMRIKQDCHMQRIIAEYVLGNSVYVFPLLCNKVGDDAEYRQYRKSINEYNRLLKKLASRLPGCPKLSSYTARHSWATIARCNHATPVSVISAGLGHASEATTRIYLASLEDSVVDEANECITSGLD